jgi:hypothetical protein
MTDSTADVVKELDENEIASNQSTDESGSMKWAMGY